MPNRNKKDLKISISMDRTCASLLIMYLNLMRIFHHKIDIYGCKVGSGSIREKNYQRGDPYIKFKSIFFYLKNFNKIDYNLNLEFQLNLYFELDLAAFNKLLFFATNSENS